MVTFAMSLCACASPVYDPYAVQEMPSHIQHRYDPIQCGALAHQCQNGSYQEWDKPSKQQRKGQK